MSLALPLRCVSCTSQLIVKAATRLDECQMIRFEDATGSFGVTDLGRVSSHYYVQVCCVVFVGGVCVCVGGVVMGV